MIIRLSAWRYWIRAPRRRYDDVVAFTQRGRRGFAHRDTFCLGAYLGVVIAHSLDHFRCNLHGHPYLVDEHEWDRILHDMSTGFRAAAQLFDDGLNHAERGRAEAERDRGFALFTLWHRELWD